MRTTLEIDDDLLAAAKDLARKEGLTIGEIISKLASQSLPPKAQVKVRNGIPLLGPRPGASPEKITLELINRLRDED